MSPDDNGQLPSEFFERLPVVNARLAANDRQVPRWRWVLVLYGAAIVLTAVATWISLFLDHRFARVGNGLLIVAPPCVLGAVGFHQLPAWRIWIRRNNSGRR